jgi:hypothetical protein
MERMKGMAEFPAVQAIDQAAERGARHPATADILAGQTAEDRGH